MSVSTTAYLSVGTTADKLFKSVGREIRDQFEIHDVKTGKPTGKTSPGEKWIVMELHDGRKLEVRGSDEMDLHEWLETELGSKISIHYDYERSKHLKDVFVGISVVSSDGYESNNIVVKAEMIDARKGELSTILKNRIGFEGEIEIALVTHCSY